MSELPLEVDVTAVKKLLDETNSATEKSFVLLDVREQNEYDFVSIDGSRLLPLSELQDRIGELEPLKDTHIIIHCHHGGRSLNATQVLRQQGFTQVQNMAGGIDDWSLQIDPEVPRY